MASYRPTQAPHTSAADTTTAVDAFMVGLEHPHKAVIEAIRSALLDAATGIAEGIKWNAPSFRRAGHPYFATVHLRERAGVALILHLGAKVRALGPDGIVVDDPAHLLKWLAKDRASLRFADLVDFEAKRPAFLALIRSWMANL
jgi:hypothetical protein